MAYIDTIHYVFNLLFLIYGSTLFVSYILIGIFSSFELSFYSKRNKFFNFTNVSEYKLLPTISIIAPCYNEEKSIIQNVRSLLSLQYPDVEVIIVNDGSKDESLDLMINHYELVKVNYSYEAKLETAEIRGIYKSTNVAYANLIVIDKDNRGKGDALNAGINVSRSELFLGIDVDCIIEPDAIFRMVKPFLEEEQGKKVIASGGVIRVANSCKIEEGRITKVNFPKNLWAQFQILEYFRAFILSRMAWSKINGLLIISGAFGLFDRKIVLNCGGYDRDTVGEDLELVMRMRNYMHTKEKTPYKVAFVPDPLCWTEVPTSLKTLGRQRNRWTRGLIDSLFKHKKMLLNPKFGRIGLIAYPYWVLFEWLGPIIEFIGIVYFFTMLYFGMINITFFILFTIFIFSFSLLYSSFAIFYEKYIFGRYRGNQFILKIILISILEMVLYHPLNLAFSLSGNFDFFFRKNKKGWGKMKREGFNS
ncbi:glycosyltransferase family 2 protein [Plebeiibacterium marinum]|uniref:Glycosyltransferase n=1 Tax=Plebeiibacterium marinum TaxID=2992111 RepID=A0AAE3SI80_9BACT|nr:glycosyltransferase family 2 protein [Plebeiobacterium marinum]MCW3804173.1 glycosyltransferase [Plebeiobacterium marinum]